MTAIVIQKFGGMAPSANQKSLSDEKAVEVHNLNLRYGDFRPTLTPVDVGNTTAGQTLYKFNRASTFITNTNDVSYVRGPVTNDETERTYYTGDGAPKVTDLTLVVRQLGVPAATAAPAYVVNTVDEFSTDDSPAAESEALTTFSNTAWANRVWSHIGLNDGELGTSLVTVPDRPWELSYVIPGTMVGGIFTPTSTPHTNLLDARFGYYLETTGGTTVAKVPLFLRPACLSFSESLPDALATILNPEDGTALISEENRDKVLDALKDQLKPIDQARDEAIERMRALKVEFTTLAASNEVLVESDKLVVRNFYARTEVTTAITAAKNAAALAIASAVATFDTVSS